MFSRLMLASVSLAVAASPLAAERIVVTAPVTSFRDIEYGDATGDRVGAARTRLAEAIPTGSSLQRARTVLVRTGARCADATPDRMRCTANSFDVVENTLHDVSWTVAVDHDGDAVTGLSVDRVSVGS